MKNLINLYKKHINPNPDASEIHNFFSSFNLGVEVVNPNEELEKIRQKDVALRQSEAEKWIYKNSKL